ncbi:hypothetical protein ACTQ49_05750 [Luteococcus sp. Sow4_B9]|uniref:hypothetical protein n=1 Tax=Luteococcus sp. Sow4_B9 TaxID=3438792 RepID=UPI003F9A5ABB
MTFKANMGVGRHGWLRLTPAYGVKLVRERISTLPSGAVITDPFSGTGTTPLAAAELGHYGQSVDVNPFLVWLGNTKMAHYSPEALEQTREAGHHAVAFARSLESTADLWQPSLFKIEKWWSPGALHALKGLRSAIDKHHGQVRDLMEIALCRTLIASSNAAFNHQSMSFKASDGEAVLFELDDVARTLDSFTAELGTIVESARLDLMGEGAVLLGDSRGNDVSPEGLRKADVLLTSPPYVNRMSYIRELRPYMYWLRYLDVASDAGDLDWKAIGGTWGSATTKVGAWSAELSTPADEAMMQVCESIRADGGKNGPVLANYVHKYFVDMWQHFQWVPSILKDGGRVSYIVGNSTFYGHVVPAQDWYATMLKDLGFTDVKVEVIRKRNSNKSLFEYDVTGRMA